MTALVIEPANVDILYAGTSGSDVFTGTSVGVYKLINNGWVKLPAIGIPKINTASVMGKKLILQGENFDPDAVILINGIEQPTKKDIANPQTTLIGKIASKKLRAGDNLQVQNPNVSFLRNSFLQAHRVIVPRWHFI